MNFFSNKNIFGMNDPNWMQNYPSVKKIWKNEKSEYRHWIILFGISLFALFLLNLISLIFNLINEDNIKSIVSKYFKVQNLNESANTFFLRTLLIMPVIKIIFFSISFFHYMQTVILSYKKKSFVHLSQIATFIVGINCFYGVWNLITDAQKYLSFDLGYIVLSSWILSIIIYFGISIHLSKIRHKFLMAEKIEALKNNNNNNFNNTFNPFQNFNNNNFNNNNNQQQNNNNNQQNNNQTNNVDENYNKSNNNNNINNLQKKQISENEIQNPEFSKRKTELLQLTLEELKLVAKKLSISGYQEMKKKELIKIILRIWENN